MDPIQRDASGMKNTETATDQHSPASMGGTRTVLFAMGDPNAEAFNPYEHPFPIRPLLTEAKAEMAGTRHWGGGEAPLDEQLENSLERGDEDDYLPNPDNHPRRSSSSSVTTPFTSLALALDVLSEYWRSDQ
ncbi:hypothetical protein INS49_013612 [Diaporthe citri]|uniref:uncharacterized protein n=1 Tax=Diaporthe citri TaxID=83186 RepID=UPI001C826423|nr:uncharacterized protein INS49_013612 [Diaporthe citri]KAG6357733.1 hypothetical protein INS49_013612 [Diaporthe citri]